MPPYRRDISASWALVPSLDHTPNGLIQVGNILVNPSEPHRPLTRIPAAEGQEDLPPILTDESVGRINSRAAWLFDRPFVPGVEVPPEARPDDLLAVYTTGLRIGSHYHTYFHPFIPREETVQASLMRNSTIQALLEQHSGGDCKLYLVNCILIAESISVEGNRYHFPEGRLKDVVNVDINDPGPKIIAYRMLEIVIDPARQVKLSDYRPAREDPHFFPDCWGDLAKRLIHRQTGAEYTREQEGEVVRISPS